MRRVLFLILCSSPAWSAVVDSAATGFTVRTTLEIQAPVEQVHDKLLQVGNWWSPRHTFFGDAHNLSIEAKPMGCFCEKPPPGKGFVRHMEVVYLGPDKLVMLGGLGPLQGLATTGSMTILLTALATNGAGTNTKLELTYTVSGYLANGLNTWAAPVDAMLAEQFTRLQHYVEHGNPEPK